MALASRLMSESPDLAHHCDVQTSIRNVPFPPIVLKRMARPVCKGIC